MPSSHSHTVLSRAHDASMLPDGENATHFTSFSCPSSEPLASNRISISPPSVPAAVLLSPTSSSVTSPSNPPTAKFCRSGPQHRLRSVLGKNAPLHFTAANHSPFDADSTGRHTTTLRSSPHEARFSPLLGDHTTLQTTPTWPRSVASCFNTMLAHLWKLRLRFEQNTRSAGLFLGAAGTGSRASADRWGAMAASFGQRFRAFLNHPAGPRTVFFWAPTMKWGLVIAGIGDMKRPVEKVSLPQNAALAATGVIWTRYSFVITPINYNLASVNLFVGFTGLYQLARIFNYRQGESQTSGTGVSA
mmetsp:Transcript_16354/g.40297  ORF Transcript_16354/g.40297 Transcript_16354/m.40297 type:complete len:303 (-) Transcript_16354:85-993(-)